MDSQDTPSPQPELPAEPVHAAAEPAAEQAAGAAESAAEQQQPAETAEDASQAATPPPVDREQAPAAAPTQPDQTQAPESARPIEAGKVDMTDALAKARAIAAKFGTLQNPPRSAPAPVASGPPAGGESGRGGDARSSRRSASPDNDDSYERRHKRDRSADDRDGQGMGRRDGGRRRYDGHGDQGYAPGGPQPVLQFPVPAQLSGLIIGRSGANLRSIEQRHGVRIQFDPSTDRRNPERQITIEGPVPAAEAARQDIMDFVERHHAERAGPPPGQGFGAPGGVTIMVPSSKVGLIIGRGGESIKDIQYASGAGVQVQPDNGASERQIQLLGTPEQVDIARARIMDIVAGDSRSARDGGPPFSGGSGGGGGYQPPPQMGYPQQSRSPGYPAPQDGRSQGGAHHLEEMQIPIEAVGVVIGRGGETIKFLQQSTGTRIQVLQGPEHSGPLRPVTIAGDYAACMRTRQMIEEKIDGMQERRGGGGGGGYGGDRRGPEQFGQGQMGDRYMQPMPGQPMHDGMYGQMQQQQQQQPYQHRGQGSRYPEQMQEPAGPYYGGAAGRQDPPAQYGRHQEYQPQQQPQQQQQPRRQQAEQAVGQWTNKTTAEYYAQHASTNPNYAQYAEYYRKLAETDPNGIVQS